MPRQVNINILTRYHQTNWALADQTLVSGVNFLTSILLARYLGVEEFGRYTLVWMVILFVKSIQHAAINSPMMSIGPKQSKDEIATYYGAIIVQHIIFSCTVSLFLYIVVLFCSVIFPDFQVKGLALPIAIASLACQSHEFLRRYFFTLGNLQRAFFNDAIHYLGQIAILVLFFKTSPDEMDTTRVLLVIAVMASIATMSGIFFVGKIKISTGILRKIAYRHWHFSKWLTASALFQWTTGNLFIIMAGALLGSSAVGALKATQNLMGVIHILIIGLENIVPVRAAQHFHDKGNRALFGYLKRVATFGCSVTAITSIVAAIAPDFWLNLVFGEKYSSYGSLLRWWAIYYLLISTIVPLTSGLRAIENSQVIFTASAWMTLFSVLTAYPIAKYFGLFGVMAGITAVGAIQVFILWSGLKKIKYAY